MESPSPSPNHAIRHTHTHTHTHTPTKRPKTSPHAPGQRSQGDKTLARQAVSRLGDRPRALETGTA
ncbi:uncharacterized protein K452DRAFT_292176 [Aplosporella prunicola CBS 121167]|uniref:Uncharacterized protein n=1 Tax=Aplosporella prunicola CBS 121167 TaxID=1176127 RepID=A0A6A6B0I8_9PEZI|nr:uncharacterized protein K452DRAFT_292176 [Aplosporella prunicola CBS 121167]KAF2136745.1 hypothetical protein K452DRAFT_292176 [Aplosporella prunicola CBS 121167]